MRLWSINPAYLDAKGLVALWREALLAQNVLLGKTRGYKNHPQLTRFKNTDNPADAIASYLVGVIDEADKRGYNFNRSKIVGNDTHRKIKVTVGQVNYEFSHLLRKLDDRDPDLYLQLQSITRIKTHSLFSQIGGEIEDWEVVAPEK